jgi:hypothetical protein
MLALLRHVFHDFMLIMCENACQFCGRGLCKAVFGLMLGRMHNLISQIIYVVSGECLVHTNTSPQVIDRVD